jgi:hypothetical protein
MRPPEREDDEVVRDRELDRLLDDWTVPALPDSLDRRVSASYRTLMRRPPLWRRFFTSSLRVPLPVAVAVLLLLVFALWAPHGKSTPTMQVVVPQGATAHFAAAGSSEKGSLAGFEPVAEMNVTVVSDTP